MTTENQTTKTEESLRAEFTKLIDGTLLATLDLLKKAIEERDGATYDDCKHLLNSFKMVHSKEGLLKDALRVVALDMRDILNELMAIKTNDPGDMEKRVLAMKEKYRPIQDAIHRNAAALGVKL